jgi:hypothetical protein
MPTRGLECLAHLLWSLASLDTHGTIPGPFSSLGVFRFGSSEHETKEHL